MLHADLLEILEYARRLGIVPNFSTRSLSWMNDKEYVTRVMSVIGAFGYSVQSVEDVARFGELMAQNRLKRDKAIAHYVMGSTTIDVYEAIIRELAERAMDVVLLGFKDVGRGKDFKPYPYSEWLEKYRSIRDDVYIKINIDTALAAESQEKLKELKIPDWLFSVKEGGHSFYIDCVKKQAGPSSYGEDVVHYSNMEDLEEIITNIDIWKEIREKFRLRDQVLGPWKDESELPLFEEDPKY